MLISPTWTLHRAEIDWILCDWHGIASAAGRIGNGTNIREGGTRSVRPVGTFVAAGGYAIERDGNEELKTKGGRRHGREKERRERRFGTARTEIVSFREREACISLRGCALDNGIFGALSSSFRLLTK